MKNPWLLTAYALTFSFAVNAQVASDTKHSTLPFRYSVVPAPEWNDLFKRSHGWFGADGTFSVPLSGIDKNNNVDNDSTLLLFSDTFVGEVKDGQPLPGYAMVNNSIAYLKGNDPDPKNIRFISGPFRPQPRGIHFALYLPGKSANSARYCRMNDHFGPGWLRCLPRIGVATGGMDLKAYKKHTRLAKSTQDKPGRCLAQRGTPTLRSDCTTI